MAELPDEEEPEQAKPVGYGQPPLHSRFKPGRSGNPRGRPTSKRATEAIVHDVLSQKIWVTIDGRRKRVAVEVAILLRLREQALKGDLRAARLLLELKRGSSTAVDPEPAGELMSHEDLAILASAGLHLTKKEQDDGGA
ncbi:MAG: DUF5681 domain-containing protein [Sphingomicrobium sp.]